MAPSVQLSCPHCGTEAAAFEHLFNYKAANGTLRCTLKCNVCEEPILVSYPGGAVDEWLDGRKKVLKDVKSNAVWPSLNKSFAPNATPKNIAKLYEQAISSFQRQHYDAAGPLFRRIMEVSIKTLHSEGKGSLYDRIEKLPAAIGVTPAMKQWAHSVRLLGRDAVHDEDLVTYDEAADMQAFVELFLIYAFDMPERVQTRQKSKQ